MLDAFKLVMRRYPLGLLLLFAAGCANATADSSVPRDGGAPRDAAIGNRDLKASSQPEMITDTECEKRGGRVRVHRHHSMRRRYNPDAIEAETRVCTYSHQKNGQRCQGDNDCMGGFCLCTGELSGPNPQRSPEARKLDGKAGWGSCSDRQLTPGEWWCLVRGGKIHVDGIIID